MSLLQERQRQLREELILDAAYSLLGERGYEGMTMDEIARQVGIAKVTLYQHFPSKEALATGIVVRQMRLLEDMLQPLYHASTPAIDRLTQVLQQSLEHQAPKWAANLPPNARFVTQDHVFQELNARRTREWEKLVDQAKVEGAIAARLSTSVLVRMMQLLFWPGYEDLLLDKRATAQELIDTLMAVIVDGIQRLAPRP